MNLRGRENTLDQNRTGPLRGPCHHVHFLNGGKLKGPLIKFNKKNQVILKLVAGAQEYEPEGPHCHENMAHMPIHHCL